MNNLSQISDDLIIKFCQDHNINVVFSELKYPNQGTYVSKEGKHMIMLTNRIREQYTLYRSTIALCLGFHISSETTPGSGDQRIFTVFEEGEVPLKMPVLLDKPDDTLALAASFFSFPLCTALYQHIANQPVKELANYLSVTTDLASQIICQLQLKAVSFVSIQKVASM